MHNHHSDGIEPKLVRILTPPRQFRAQEIPKMNDILYAVRRGSMVKEINRFLVNQKSSTKTRSFAYNANQKLLLIAASTLRKARALFLRATGLLGTDFALLFGAWHLEPDYIVARENDVDEMSCSETKG
jgi:hypothetical protein